MRNDWKYERLLDACDVYQPATISTKQLVEDGEFDVFGANGKIGKYSSYNHEESEVLLTCRGATCGNINVSTPKSWINGNAMVVHPKEKNLLKNYLVYLLKTINYAEVITGSAQPQITRLSLKNIHIPVPPLSEQERIVSLLDAEFAKIDALKANAASQLQAAKDLFQAALKQLLTPQKGWEEKTLGNICISIKDGDWIEKKDQSPTGIRLLQTGNIGVGIYKDKSDSPHYISLDTFNRLHCEEVFAGDILLSRLPEPVGRACLVPKMEGRFITAVDCSIIKINTEKVTPAYLIYYTQTNAYFKSISSLCTGTTRQRISRKKLEEVSISFPSLPEQERIAARLDEISEKVKALQANYDQTITLCNDLKQSLLKSIFE